MGRMGDKETGRKRNQKKRESGMRKIETKRILAFLLTVPFFLVIPFSLGKPKSTYYLMINRVDQDIRISVGRISAIRIPGSKSDLLILWWTGN
jgi:hypothetical protein